MQGYFLFIIREQLSLFVPHFQRSVAPAFSNQENTVIVSCTALAINLILVFPPIEFLGCVFVTR